MKGSIIASQIDYEYKLKQKYKNKERQKCIVDEKKQCNICKYRDICEGVEENEKVD